MNFLITFLQTPKHSNFSRIISEENIQTILISCGHYELLKKTHLFLVITNFFIILKNFEISKVCKLISNYDLKNRCFVEKERRNKLSQNYLLSWNYIYCELMYCHKKVFFYIHCTKLMQFKVHHHFL